MNEMTDVDLESKLTDMLESLPTNEQKQQTLKLIDEMIKHGVSDEVAVDFLLNQQPIQ